MKNHLCIFVIVTGALTGFCVLPSAASSYWVEDQRYGYGEYTTSWAYVGGWWDIEAHIVTNVHHIAIIVAPPLPWGGFAVGYPEEGGSARRAWTRTYAGYWIDPNTLLVDSEALAAIPEIP